MKLGFVLSWFWAAAAPILGATFTNPVLWEDLADLEVIRVNDVFYYSASTMHYSPGAPILRSYDLINWEFIGHSVPVLDWSSKYDLTNGQNAYVKGIWASSLKYRPSTGTYYWIGCIEFSTTYVYTAQSITGPWTKRGTINTCYYDCGLLVDDDDTLYVAYGSTTINVAQLSSDGLSQVKTQAVFTAPSNVGYIEGSRFYKIKGKYYILNTHPADSEYVLQGNSPWGPYTQKLLEKNFSPPVSGAGIPHQGGLVDTPDGHWYYMAFIDNYPGGRTPVLAPATFGSDGFPMVTTGASGGWGINYDYPLPSRAVASPAGTDTFTGTALGPAWEWNHNPDTTKFRLTNPGLALSAATVTSDLYSARNTLTHRILGPISTATIQLGYGSMRAGDRAGLAMLRDRSAWVGVTMGADGKSPSVAVTTGLAMGADWKTISTGTVQESVALPALTTSASIWLRATADIHPGASQTAKFAYSIDGMNFRPIGQPFTMNNTYYFFMGYRYGIFNYATSQLGGSVSVTSFSMTAP